VRRAWTLLDRAYNQCRRALNYLRFDDEDADTLAPSLRRNTGKPQPTDRPPATPTPPPVIQAQSPVPHVAAAVAEPSIGDGAAPFLAKS
jgi:hypothetical protein